MVEPLPRNARLLMVRLSSLGDVVFALENLASLKAERPDVTVDFVVEDRFAPLLEGHPQIDRLLVVPRRRKAAIPAFVFELRRRRYDVVLDLHGILKSAWLVALSRCRRTLGFARPGAREGADRFYRERVVLPQPLPHRVDRGYFLLRALGLRGATARPVLRRPERDPAFWPPADGRRRVVLHPGVSASAPFKRWPVARYAELARRLCAGGCRVAVSYGPGEQETMAPEFGPPTDDLLSLDGGAFDLVEVAAIFAQADLMVAADTGPLHLGAAAGCPVVALFGPKDPVRYRPRGDGHRVLFHDVPCRPCSRRRCPTPQCVLGLTVDRVESAVYEALGPCPRTATTRP